MTDIKLGEQQAYESQYNPKLLSPIPRALSRVKLASEVFLGEDIWTAFELSWLDGMGKPQVAIVEFRVPCASEFLVESKSFKYYLNSFNQSSFDSWLQVQTVLQTDLSAATGAAVTVQMYELEHFWQKRVQAKPLGEVIDALPLSRVCYEPCAVDFEAKADAGSEQVWVSHLLKSNCPVTGQPDWASVWFGITGATLNPARLLEYVISFREHQDFHEHCVEQMFVELQQALNPERLWVYARYTRRGGLDINPFRASEAMQPPDVIGVRQ